MTDDKWMLIVDDEPKIRLLMKRYLNLKGYTVMLAKNGEEGFQLFSQHSQRFELCIVDLNLPDISGDVLLQKIKKIKPEIRIGLVSGDAKTRLAEKSIELQPNFTLSKPFSLHHLMEYIRIKKYFQ